MTDASNSHGMSAAPDALVSLARETIERFVREGKLLLTPKLPDDLPQQAGCFVSIHLASSGDLRGCIGTIEPTRKSLAEEVIHNAIAASTQDPRFPKIGVGELDNLAINVDVLFPAEPASLDELDPKRYGVIVSKGFKRGLLLPDLEGVDTVEEQLAIACAKAGINPAGGFDVERFEVVRHI
ncbi:MAG: AmmeMemoRadiSam system protein A [Eggerthellaceae bacterium]|jgi:AmmeMemoRadiSam system protein A|nr:AmmeMemoRadiSam system protein A [Eggerthellaceae bacterium]MDR2721923.1 AmmeMemoRadiSam system protein A [Coriobacteriaceae bacterium]